MKHRPDLLHEGVFYTLSDIMSFTPLEPDTDRAPGAILIPHARFCLIRPQLEWALGQARSFRPKLVTVLQNLHRPALAQDSVFDAFCPPARKVCTGGLEMNLVSSDHPSVATRQCYFEEEPGPELAAALCSRVFAGVPVLELLSNPAPACPQNLSGIISSILKDHPRTLFVVSSNSTDPECARHMEKRDFTGMCARFWLDALACRWETGQVGGDGPYWPCAVSSEAQCSAETT